MKILSALLCALLLFGCASTPVVKDWSKVDAGPPPDTQAAVEQYIRDTFKDPHSVQDLTLLDPVKTVVNLPPITGGGQFIGWKVAFTCNAKNSFGGYTGVSRYEFYWRDGQIVYLR